MKDNRQLATVRYLRRVYLDPFTWQAQWGTIGAPDGGIQGVYSLTQGTPVKTAGFAAADVTFANAKSYAEWRFEFVPIGAGVLTPTNAR